jgi:hypothetical protein
MRTYSSTKSITPGTHTCLSLLSLSLLLRR